MGNSQITMLAVLVIGTLAIYWPHFVFRLKGNESDYEKKKIKEKRDVWGGISITVAIVIGSFYACNQCSSDKNSYDYSTIEEDKTTTYQSDNQSTEITQAEPQIKIINDKKIELNGYEINCTKNGLLFKMGNSGIYPTIKLVFPSEMYVTYQDKSQGSIMTGHSMQLSMKGNNNQIETERLYLPGKYAFIKSLADAHGGNENVPKEEMNTFESLSFKIIIVLDGVEYTFDDCLEDNCNHDKCRTYKILRRGILLGRLYDF